MTSTATGSSKVCFCLISGTKPLGSHSTPSPVLLHAWRLLHISTILPLESVVFSLSVQASHSAHCRSAFTLNMVLASQGSVTAALLVQQQFSVSGLQVLDGLQEVASKEHFWHAAGAKALPPITDDLIFKIGLVASVNATQPFSGSITPVQEAES